MPINVTYPTLPYASPCLLKQNCTTYSGKPQDKVPNRTSTYPTRSTIIRPRRSQFGLGIKYKQHRLPATNHNAEFKKETTHMSHIIYTAPWQDIIHNS